MICNENEFLLYFYVSGKQVNKPWEKLIRSNDADNVEQEKRKEQRDNAAHIAEQVIEIRADHK